MNQEIQLFQFSNNGEEHSVRTVIINNETWFVAKDLCIILGYSRVNNAVKYLDDDEKLLLQLVVAGQKRLTYIVSESGLYGFILRSRKPFAKVFRKWVTQEVIPSIRKTGEYGTHGHAFIKRFNANWKNIDNGYFSVISELYVRLYGKFEMYGHIIPDKAFDGKEIRPDNSVGRLYPSEQPHLP